MEPMTGRRMRRFAVVSYLGHAGGGPEGACACEALFSEHWSSGLEVGVEPVSERVAEVHESTFGDTAGHLGYEGVVLFLTGVEGFVEGPAMRARAGCCFRQNRWVATQRL